MPLNAVSSPLSGSIPADINVHNAGAADIPAGSLVYFSGWNAAAGKFNVALADNGAFGTLAQLVTRAGIAALSDGAAQLDGPLSMDTHLAAVGDPVYLGLTGLPTLTNPTLSTSYSQIIGRVQVVAVAGAYNVWVNFAGRSAAANSLATFGLQKWTYSFAVNGGVAGTIALTGPGLPANALVLAGVMEVITIPVGVGSSGAVQVQAANDVINAAAIVGAPWSTVGRKTLIPVISDLTKTIKTTALKQPSVVVSGANWTAGAFDLFLLVGLASG